MFQGTWHNEDLHWMMYVMGKVEWWGRAHHVRASQQVNLNGKKGAWGSQQGQSSKQCMFAYSILKICQKKKTGMKGPKARVNERNWMKELRDRAPTGT
jgi:hypothetical protein